MATVNGSDSDDTIFGGLDGDDLYGGMGDDTIYGGNSGRDTLHGGEGDDLLHGGEGDDTLFGGEGDDTLFGGSESPGKGGDRYVFEFDFGRDTIVDFLIGREVIALRSGNMTSFADVQSRMSQVGPDTGITMDEGSSITLKNTDASNLTAANFEIGSPVCYAAGTLLLTSHGEVAVEDLAPGDLLVTADRGPQPIRWVGVSRHRFASGPHGHKPLEIKAGALGGGLPRRRLVVSPQHRILVCGAAVEALFGVPEALALARALTGLPRIRAMSGKREVTYYSLLCDRHEIVMAEGWWSESFYPGPTALRALGPRLRAEVESLFPALRDDSANGYGARARRVLTRAETEALVREITSGRRPHAADAAPGGQHAAEFSRWDEDLARERAEASRHRRTASGGREAEYSLRLVS